MINKVIGKGRNTELQLGKIFIFIKLILIYNFFAFLSYDHFSSSWQNLKFMNMKEILNFPN